MGFHEKPEALIESLGSIQLQRCCCTRTQLAANLSRVLRMDSAQGGGHKLYARRVLMFCPCQRVTHTLTGLQVAAVVASLG